ncbi:PaaX family transcriptional regulator [Subtercola sp. YIM 133946]|uniref:PaaX family transcriptional regulator n=1 Tax=Subtercola sp. YIM 133946 TaxID=3118909 RepID=UPI002F93D55A
MSMKATVTPAPRRTKTLLLTIIGEIMVPVKHSVWQEVLVECLGTLDVTVAAARQAVARAVGDTWLTSERIGRRSLLTLTEETAAGLAEGRERTWNFGKPREWDGQWLFVALTVPEESRALRHHFRTELAWLGFGSLGNGLWISPHTENEKATLKLLGSSDGPSDAFVFSSAQAASHTPRELASAAWDLAGLRQRFDTFCERFENERPQTPGQYFSAWIDMHTSWRHFPLFDPELPDRLLPRDWPRHRAVQLFHERNAEWTPPAMAFFDGLEAESQA